MEATQAAAVAPEEPPPSLEAGLIGNATALWDDLRDLAHDHIELAVLETQRAGESLVSIVIFGIVTAVLIVTAWMGLVAAFALWLIDRGLAASAAVLIAVLLNLAAAAGLVFAIRLKSQYLTFPSTVRALKHRRTAAAAAEKAEKQ